MPSGFPDRARGFWAACRGLNYTLGESTAAAVTSSLTAARRLDTSIDADAMHAMLEVARLVSLSFGEILLTEMRWNYVLSLDANRRESLKVAVNTHAVNAGAAAKIVVTPSRD